LGAAKKKQWMVAFALETEDPRIRAMQKLERKNCDLIVVNGPRAIHAPDTQVEILDTSGRVTASFTGGKQEVARQVFRVIEERLIHRRC
jgi:phosphopantothenoylcysteine decarboxylase/phosphopantothenate--cysteine ligase